LSVNPVTLNDLAEFISSVVKSFDSYLYYSLTLMICLYVGIGIRRLFIGVKQDT